MADESIFRTARTVSSNVGFTASVFGIYTHTMLCDDNDDNVDGKTTTVSCVISSDTTSRRRRLITTACGRSRGTVGSWLASRNRLRVVNSGLETPSDRARLPAARKRLSPGITVRSWNGPPYDSRWRRTVPSPRADLDWPCWNTKALVSTRRRSCFTPEWVSRLRYTIRRGLCAPLSSSFNCFDVNHICFSRASFQSGSVPHVSREVFEKIIPDDRVLFNFPLPTSLNFYEPLKEFKQGLNKFVGLEVGYSFVNVTTTEICFPCAIQSCFFVHIVILCCVYVKRLCFSGLFIVLFDYRLCWGHSKEL